MLDKYHVKSMPLKKMLLTLLKGHNMPLQNPPMKYIWYYKAFEPGYYSIDEEKFGNKPQVCHRNT